MKLHHGRKSMFLVHTKNLSCFRLICEASAQLPLFQVWPRKLYFSGYLAAGKNHGLYLLPPSVTRFLIGSLLLLFWYSKKIVVTSFCLHLFLVFWLAHLTVHSKVWKSWGLYLVPVLRFFFLLAYFVPVVCTRIRTFGTILVVTITKIISTFCSWCWPPPSPWPFSRNK